MKKLARLAAVFAALAMMGTGFIACSDDDDDNNNTPADTTEQNPTGDGETEKTPEPQSSGGETGSVTYDFATLTSADLTTLGITATAGTDKDTCKIPQSTNEYTVSNKALLYSKADGNLNIRVTTKGDVTSAIKAVNFGGQSIGNSTTDATPGDVGSTESGSVSRYIAFPVSADSFTVSVTYKPTNTKGIQLVIVDENGKILAKDAANSSQDEKVYTTGTLAKGTASKIRIYMYRTGDKTSGGMDVSKVVITPVE